MEQHAELASSATEHARRAPSLLVSQVGAQVMDVTNTVTPELHELAEAFGQRGFGLRLVGGCVRDLLADKTPKDVDLCTDANPDEAMAIYRELDVRHIPTGLDHF